MASKALVTRKTNTLAGARPPLPGQDHHREASLRAELARELAPAGAIEMIWLGEIAACGAAIEVIRAQIAGFWMLKVREACKAIGKGDLMDEQGGYELDYGTFSPTDRDWLATFAAQNFTPTGQKSFLDNVSFSLLLGSMSRSDTMQLRSLQESLQSETRERDRIINQFDRRRRQAMRDAIELAEANRRAALAGAVPVEAGQDAVWAEAHDANEVGDSWDDAVVEDTPAEAPEPTDPDGSDDREEGGDGDTACGTPANVAAEQNSDADRDEPAAAFRSQQAGPA